jgi:hypothetical protein
MCDKAGSKVKIVSWISYETHFMYFTNAERNRVLYQLWEKNLTVEEISSNTNIPRSTVGYYVRKFNRLAAKGKPVVFPGLSQNDRKQGSNAEDSSIMQLLQLRIMDLMKLNDWERLYYLLNVFRLLKELGFFTGIQGDILRLFLKAVLAKPILGKP